MHLCCTCADGTTAMVGKLERSVTNTTKYYQNKRPYSMSPEWQPSDRYTDSATKRYPNKRWTTDLLKNWNKVIGKTSFQSYLWQQMLSSQHHYARNS